MIRTQEVLITESKKGFIKKIRSKSSGQNYADVFIYEPTNAEEGSLGSLYFVAELTDVSTDSSHLINLLISSIRREYYAKPDQDSLESFENSLKKTNAIIGDLVRGTDSKKNIECLNKLNCLCAVLHQNKIHFTKIGQFKLILSRQGKPLDIGKKLTDHSEKNSIKNFQNVISGQLEAEDRLLFASPRLLNFFTAENLNSIFSGDFCNSREQLTKLLKEQKSFSAPVAALFLEVVAEQPLKENCPASDDHQKYITPPIYLDEIFSNNHT